MRRLRELAQLRVGTKLVLLAMLPVACLLAFALISGAHDLRAAQRLRDFRTASRVSSAKSSTSHKQERVSIGTCRSRSQTSSGTAMVTDPGRASNSAPIRVR